MHAPQCHVTHLVYRLATGGMENVVVQLIRHLPRTSFRHTVIALCDIDPEFARRLDGTDVELIALNKPPGQPYALYPTVYRLLRRLRPDVLHSCNLAALEFAPVAALARVPLRVHVEHGLDLLEINGKSTRYRLLRRLYRPFVNQYVAVSVDQARQCAQLGAAAERVHLIPNGVDTRVFRPRTGDDPLPAGFPFQRDRHWVIGTVGRQADIKNPLLLVDAFVHLVRSGAPGTERLRLAMVGEGPLHGEIAQRLRDEGLSDRAWLPGARSDIADILRAFDCFVLPSLSEATSCALQEAMATGLAIVATNVGGNADVLDQGRCGSLVPSGDATALATELQRLCQSGQPNAQAQEALISVQRRYSLETVIQRYGDLFLNAPAQGPRDTWAQQPAPLKTPCIDPRAKKLTQKPHRPSLHPNVVTFSTAMKILTFSTLYPNAVKQHHGIFTETALKQVMETGTIETVVVAPVPWFPFTHKMFGDYAGFAKVPKEEMRSGVRVLHPRYFLPPKMGMHVAPFLMAMASRPAVARLLDEGFDFDVIDAHYFYPDGVAATLLGRYFNKPVVISALGTDINLIPRFYLPRKMILWAGKNAAAVVTVCEALKTELKKIGLAREDIMPLRNGVDLELFKPVDRVSTRAELGISGFTLLSVGYLVARKGHHRAIAALQQMPDVTLAIAGGGPDENKLKKLAMDLGVQNRVKFLGVLSQKELCRYYGACDALVLASSREGWANVLLESMACGTPVVASNIWGTPEVITSPEAGVLMPSNTPAGIAQAVAHLRSNYPLHTTTRAYAERFSWSDTTAKKVGIYSRVRQQSEAVQ